jgi:hypothetical protein
MGTNLEAIKKAIAPVLKRHRVLRAGIFGSFASGKMTENSDIDILVELAEDKSLLDLAALKLALEEAVGRTVDVVEYSTIHPLLKDRILREQTPVV